MRLSREFIHDLLTTGRAGPRLLQESAVLIDVWTAYGDEPERAVDLLLTPMDSLPAARLASELHDEVLRFGPGDEDLRPRIFPLEGFVAVHATRELFLKVLLPMTGANIAEGILRLEGLVGLTPSEGLTLQDLLRFARGRRASLSPDLRVTLLYLLMIAADPADLGSEAKRGVELPKSVATLSDILNDAPPISVDPVLEEARGHRSIWQIACNRSVTQMGRSSETVKADAARRLFKTSARHLTWAVIDSGIDGSHPAFRDHAAGGFASRVTKAYDFTRLRDIAAYDVLLDDERNKALKASVIALGMSAAEAEEWIARLQADARNGRPFDWAVLSGLLETRPDKLESADRASKPNGHGTHVAGVLAGDWREGDKPVFEGVCPDLKLYDLRILNEDLTVPDTEFAVIAALEFVRWINSRNRYPTIHGVNLSIGLEHDVRNFACGQTPVCRACDATVRSGVVVVAAAGNDGFHRLTASDGDFSSYSGMTINDPGNTESVITVGSTHRDRPHEYGVSYFSSRGPTGDGRRKPDLVAPGEKIDGPLPGLGLGRLDGTSMSAPHVSGVAALLMARHAELVGQPMTIKHILIETATDLGRERHFQGAGLVDALRALQSR
ncbi:MAG TPA: S8 family peptidase [Phenylobacterium sp.]